MPPKGVKIPPVCNKCEKSHWPFRPCSEGVVYKQVGYDTIVKATGYRSSYGRIEHETDYNSKKPASVRERTYYRGED